MIESINFYSRFDSLEWIFVGIALFFFLSGLISVFVIFASRNIKSYYLQRETILKCKFNPILSSIVVNESISDVNIPGSALESYLRQLREITDNSSFAKDVLIQQIVITKKNLAGRSAALLIEVYRALGLEKVSLSKLSKLAWNKRAKGIRELAEMNSFTSTPHIHKYLRSGNQTLREEAVMALVRLDDANPLFFLDDYQQPLTSWMRLNIFHYLQKMDPRKLPQFSRWFLHTNRTVAMFSVNMTRQFRQREAIPHLVNLLTKNDHEMIAMAIDTLGELDAYEQADVIASLGERHFEKKSVMIQIAKCLGKVGSQAHIPLLVKFLEHDDHQVRFEAMRAIKKLDERALLNLSVLPGSNLSKTLLHLQEPLLQ